MSKQTFIPHCCNKCGKTFINYFRDRDFQLNENQWYLLKRDNNIFAEYGSSLDTEKIEFELCDKCLEELNKNFVFKLNYKTTKTHQALVKAYQTYLKEIGKIDDNTI